MRIKKHNNMPSEKFQRKFLCEASNINENILREILKISRIQNINPEIVFAIITVEIMNRGGNLNKFIESTLVKLLPSLVIKTNLSIGIGQVKIETAKHIFPISERELIRELLNTEVNIFIVTKLIANYLSETQGSMHQLKKVVNLYTTGKIAPQNNKELEMYYYLVRWSINRNTLHKIVKNS